ncbi:(5-formylfuran-3-yl)methyl phosphate synthase [Methylomagnum sp.]
MTGLLASVANLAEARLVAEAGADIIDLKNPAAGALGALSVGEVARIVDALGGQRPVSATIGDLPMEPGVVGPAVEATAATGVDYVKIGFFPGGDWSGVIDGLRPVTARGVRLVAVLFGDCGPELRWVAELAEAGFTGAMLDTADKACGSLRAVCGPGFLRDFVAETRRRGLLCGLAGSLRAGDVGPLLELGPDYLGFRGALCGGNRTGVIEVGAVRGLVGLVRGNVAGSQGS